MELAVIQYSCYKLLVALGPPGKEELPSNSPDLNPIKNLFSILEEKMKMVKYLPQNIA